MRLTHHLRYAEKDVSPIRRIGQHLLLEPAIGHAVLPQAQRLGAAARHRLHAVGIDRLQLLDPAKDAIQFGLEARQLVFLNPDAGERRDAPDSGGVERHSVFFFR
jgi:hypothetical protein